MLIKNMLIGHISTGISYQVGKGLDRHSLSISVCRSTYETAVSVLSFISNIMGYMRSTATIRRIA